MANLRTLVSKPTRRLSLLSSLYTATSRLLPSLNTASSRLCSSSSNPPPDWRPQIYAAPFVKDPWNIDIGRWYFGVKSHLIECACASEKDFYKFLTKAVGEKIGSEAEAQKRIYFISFLEGFGGYFDKETRDKIVDLEFISCSKPDLYYEARRNHPTTRQLSLQ